MEHGKNIGAESLLQLRIIYIENVVANLLLRRVIDQNFDMPEGVRDFV